MEWGESYADMKRDALHMAVGTQCGMGLRRDSLEAGVWQERFHISRVL